MKKSLDRELAKTRKHFFAWIRKASKGKPLSKYTCSQAIQCFKLDGGTIISVVVSRKAYLLPVSRILRKYPVREKERVVVGVPG